MTSPPAPVVVGIDGSSASLQALRRAIREAEVKSSSLHIIHSNELTEAIVHLPSGTAATTSDLTAQHRAEIWAGCKEVLEATGTKVDVEFFDKSGRAGDVLVEHCKEMGADLLVVGSVGRNPVTAALLGSTAQRVASRAECDVLLVKGGG